MFAAGWLHMLSGCAPAVVLSAGITAGFGLAQTQATQFINGEIKAARQVTMDQAVASVRTSMTELQLVIKIDRRSSRKAYIMGQAEGGPQIGVTLIFISPVATKFNIRVGMLGDQAISRLLMERIDAQLKPWIPATPP